MAKINEISFLARYEFHEVVTCPSVWLGSLLCLGDSKVYWFVSLNALFIFFPQVR